MTDSTAWARRLYSVLGVPSTAGNEVRVLRNGDEIFPAMLSAIDDATRTIDIVTFVYWSGDIAQKFAERLADAAKRGCRVRVLLDAVGARKMNTELVDRMSAAGCEVRWFRPILDGGSPEIGQVNHRTHRKVLVCDGKIGFTGGVGIADEWSGDARDESEWRDSHVAVRGPAVAGLQAAFIDNWADEATDDFDAADEFDIDGAKPGTSECIVIRGSSETGASDIWRLTLAMAQLATRRLRVASAYFNPDTRMVDALCSAAQRGVVVQLLLPGEHADKRFVQINGESNYQELLDAGVSIRTYERSMMHAKVMTVDGSVASIGSANLNERSMQHDEECNLVVFDPDVVAVFDRHFDDDLTQTIDLDPERWADRGIVQKVAEKVSGVADRWL